MSTKKNDAGEAQVQAEADKVAEKGYVGESTDPTPAHAYTVAGVTKGEPTPETDKGAAEKAREHQASLAEGVTETGRRS